MINVILVIMFPIVIFLDYCGICTGRGEENEETNKYLPDGDEVLDLSEDREKVGEGVKVEEIRVEEKKVEEEKLEVVRIEKVRCCQAYVNAFRYYHRIGNLFFSATKQSSRVVKLLNTWAQLCLCCTISTVIMGIPGSANIDHSELYAAACATSVMRIA